MRVTAILFCLLLFFAAQPQAAEQEEELLIGLEPEHNIFDQVERYRVLTDYIAREFGVRIRLTITSRYGEVLQRFKTRRLDGAFLSSFTADLAINEFGLEPVVRLVSIDGGSFAHAYIFARRDSGIKTAADMKGRSFVFVDPSTTEGYLFPLAFLKRHGVDDKDSFLGRYYFSGSHVSAVSAVLDGRAEIGSAKSTAYNRLVAADPSIGSELYIIDQSPALPGTTLCIKKDLAAGLKEKLVAGLMQMMETERGREVLQKMEVRSFIRADASDYKIISEMKRDVGILSGR